MTFDSNERSVDSGVPIELYKFVGNYNTYRMTNALTDKVNAEGTYLATSIKRSKKEIGTQEETNIALVVELPFDHSMVTEYAFNVSPPSLEMTLWKVHEGDLNATQLQWQGEILSWNVEDGIAKLKIPSFFGFAMDGPIPPIKYQSPCNHVLYDSFCQVVDTAFKSDVTIVSIVGNVIEVNSSPFADGLCDGGEMIYTAGGEGRMITENTGTSFTVASAFSGLSVSDTVTLRQGCNHAFNGDCKSKFSNGINFGGFPLVPNRNPFGGRL